jgi:hypothetical protein
MNKGSADDRLGILKLQSSAVFAKILLPFVTSLGPATDLMSLPVEASGLKKALFAESER